MDAAVTAHGGSVLSPTPRDTANRAGDLDLAQHTSSSACFKTEMYFWLFVQLCVSIFLRMFFYFYTLAPKLSTTTFQTLLKSVPAKPVRSATSHNQTTNVLDYNTKNNLCLE